MIQNDNDIIRGLGFVTLYAAYLEEQIDNLLTMLEPINTYNSEKQRWMISKKIKHAKDILESINDNELCNLVSDLGTCIELFENRNELIHGRIYGNFNRPDTLKSGRPNIPEREILPEELYQLANELNDFRLAIYQPMIFKLPRAICKHNKP